jgi:hypothetical protein
MFIFYSVVYNGLVMILSLSAGIIFIGFFISYHRFVSFTRRVTWPLVSIGLIVNAILKFLFFRNISIDTPLPFWTSPAFDFALLVLAIWVIHLIVRLKSKC